MKKIICMFLILSAAVSAFSQTIKIDGKAPTSDEQTINDLLNAAFNGLKTQLNKEIGSLNVVPENLIRAFGNASVYSSHGATQRGYSGYKTFEVTLGSTLGFQLPTSPFKIMDTISGNPLEGIFKDGDITFGINPQIIDAEIGINTSFLLKDLYMGFRVGFTPDLGNMMNDVLGDMGGLGFSFSNFLIGITANYQLIGSKSIAGIITWRGINLGTGLLLQNTKLKMAYPLPSMTQTLETYTNTKLKIDPRLSFNMDITTFTIPLEVMTAVNLIFLNIPLGVGVDFAFGKSAMNIGMHSDIVISGGNELIGTTKPGYLTVDAGGEVSPTFANLKLMTGIGLNIGPIILDIPVTWYFVDNGLNVGVTFGLMF